MTFCVIFVLCKLQNLGIAYYSRIELEGIIELECLSKINPIDFIVSLIMGPPFFNLLCLEVENCNT